MKEEQLSLVVEASRPALLAIALQDAKNWCSSPDVRVGGKPSDQHWVRRFSEAGDTPLSAADAHEFLVTFMLTNRITWDKGGVADAITWASSGSVLSAVELVLELSGKLRKANTKKNRQTSAASKIALFAKPNLPVFIWDKLASRAARLRDWRRASPKPQRGFISRSYVHENGEHDYPAYWNACALALGEELADEDFTTCLKDFSDYLAGTSGPMSAFARDGDFPARRLLDKLIFWEGHLIREIMDEESTVGKVNEILQGRLDDLQRVPLVKRRIDEPVV